MFSTFEMDSNRSNLFTDVLFVKADHWGYLPEEANGVIKGKCIFFFFILSVLFIIIIQKETDRCYQHCTE